MEASSSALTPESDMVHDAHDMPERRQPNYIDFIVIAVYFIFVLVVGLWVSWDKILTFLNFSISSLKFYKSHRNRN
jgi:hypothetical protein